MSMTAGAIAALLNTIMRLGIAWQEYGVLIDRVRAEGRQVTEDDVADLARRARVSLDGLQAAIADADDAAEAEPEVATEENTAPDAANDEEDAMPGNDDLDDGPAVSER